MAAISERLLTKVSAESAADGGRPAGIRAGSALSDARLIAGTRLFLAVAGLLIVLLVPWEVDRFYSAVLLTVILHSVYAAALYAVQALSGGGMTFGRGWLHWLDVGWYLLLISLTGGANSVFFYGFFLPILVASFRWGFGSGIRVTAISAVFFTVFGYLAAPPAPEFEMQRFLIRPAFIVALGYMMASWGGFEMKLRRRLRFLKDVGTVSNPRFGIDRTAGVLMHRLLGLYQADACVLITGGAPGGGHELRRARRDEPEGPVASSAIPAELASRLIGLPRDSVVVYSRSRGGVAWRFGSDGVGKRTRAARDASVDVDACDALAANLDAASVVAARCEFPRGSSVSLTLAFREDRKLDESDAAFLVQVLEHAFPLIENIRLVDRLASEAATEERRRVARDLHDSVIQPYVGLRIALSGLRQKLGSPGADVAVEIDRLVELATLGVEDLRKRVLTLREGGGPSEGLVPAVGRFAARFAEVTGIAVEVVARGDLVVSDRVAGDVFQMVAEGLSNVRRHTGASRATVRLGVGGGVLVLVVEDHGTSDGRFVPFTPRSIVERAESLGGRASVSGRDDGGAIVRVEIPL